MEKIKKLVKKLFKIKLIRYLFTGGILFIIDFAVFYALKEIINLDIRISQFISRGVGAAIGFISHKFFVFENEDTRLIGLSIQGILYTGLVIVNIFLSGFLIYWLDTLLPVKNILVLKIVNEVIMVIETYLLLNLIFGWKKRGKKEDTEEKRQ